MDSKIALDANSQPEKNLITKQVREGKIKYYFLKKFGKRLTIQRYLAHQNIPNIIVFLIFYQCTRLLPLVVTSGTESRGAAKILGSGTQRKYDLISLFHLLNYNE